MIVLDVNAAIAMLFNTEEGGALLWLKLESEETIAPSLFFAELAHVLPKYSRQQGFTPEEARDLAVDAAALVDRFVDDSELWMEAMGEAMRLGHSSYDMFYLVLARRQGATLFTLDRKLQRLCAKAGVSCVWLEDMT